MTTEIFTEAFQPAADKIAADFGAYFIRGFDRCVESFGASLQCRDAYHRDYAMLRMVRRWTEEVPGENGRITYMPSAPKRLRTDKLAVDAIDYAQAQIAAFVAKLVRKLEGLDVAEVVNQRGLTFVIRGTLNGHQVMVEQQQVFKVSNKGTPFNQWPARIYVDGKFTPEAKFKEAVAL
jgi:hypothetical protein